LRALGAAGVIGLAAPLVDAARSYDAQASVSVAVLLEELVRDSTGVATVTAREQRAVWENGRIFTYTRVTIDSIVAGDLPAEAWVRTMGGIVGKVGQAVEGEATFAQGQHSLLFLRRRQDAYSVTARAQGQYPLVTGNDNVTRLVSASGVGGLLPPTPARVARVLPTSQGAPRFAHDLLHGRPLDEATREIAALFRSQRR
jgi:hypothetical protein